MQTSFWDALDAGLRRQANASATAARPRRPRTRGAGFYLTEKAERLLADRDRRQEDR